MRFLDSSEVRRALRPPPGVPPSLAAVGGAAVVLAAYVLGVLSPRGRVLDEKSQRLVGRLGAGVEWPVHAVLAYASPAVVGVGVVVVAVKAARRGDRMGAASVLGLVVGSELVTQALKMVLPHPGGGANSLPSGHVTMMAAFVVALVARAEWSRRPVLLGAGVVLAGALGTMIVGWHRPSDDVAACGVVAMCAGAIRLLGVARERRRAAVGGALDHPTPPTSVSWVPLVPDRSREPAGAAVLLRAPRSGGRERCSPPTTEAATVPSVPSVGARRYGGPRSVPIRSVAYSEHT